jgi:hypothetical protein
MIEIGFVDSFFIVVVNQVSKIIMLSLLQYVGYRQAQEIKIVQPTKPSEDRRAPKKDVV